MRYFYIALFVASAIAAYWATAYYLANRKTHAREVRDGIAELERMLAGREVAPVKAESAPPPQPCPIPGCRRGQDELHAHRDVPPGVMFP